MEAVAALELDTIRKPNTIPLDVFLSIPDSEPNAVAAGSVGQLVLKEVCYSQPFLKFK